MSTILSFRLLGYLLFSFFIVACCGNSDLQINPALTKTWLPYQSQQKISFVGNNNDTISFNTARRSYFQEATDKACGPYKIQTEEVTLSTTTDAELRLLFSLSHEMVLNLKAMRNRTSVSELEAKFNLVSEEYITHAWRDNYLKEQVVNGKPFHQVLQVFGNNIPGSLVISEILYVRDKGLIGFKTFTTGWYFLSEK